MNTHECAQSKNRLAGYDCGTIGPVVIERNAEGDWRAGTDDAALIGIAFCPYCGEKLLADGPQEPAKDQQKP